MTLEEFKQRCLNVKVNQTTGCRLWYGDCAPNKYVSVRLGKKNYGGHRLILNLKLGRAIKENFFALHTCDNKSCIEETHIYEGTHQDNMDDMKRRGRVAKGDRHTTKLHPEKIARGNRHGSRTKIEKRPRGLNHHMAKQLNQKLPKEKILSLQKLAKTMSRNQLAIKFKISRPTVSSILNKTHWSVRQ